MILNNLPVDSTEIKALYRAHVLPEPHLREGRFLAGQSGIRAAIDVSDGLSSDIGHIAEQSEVGATIYATQIPISDSLQTFCAAYGFDPLEYALGGGEDYILLCTAAPQKADEIAQNFQRQFKQPLFRIGKTTADRRLEIVYANGTSRPISPRGWDHFKKD